MVLELDTSGKGYKTTFTLPSTNVWNKFCFHCKSWKCRGTSKECILWAVNSADFWSSKLWSAPAQQNSVCQPLLLPTPGANMTSVQCGEIWTKLLQKLILQAYSRFQKDHWPLEIKLDFYWTSTLKWGNNKWWKYCLLQRKYIFSFIHMEISLAELDTNNNNPNLTTHHPCCSL